MKTLIALLFLVPQDAKTEHYDVLAETLDARDVGAMLEELHDQLAKHFGRAPKERLAVSIYATGEKWAAGLRADGQPVPTGAGGYYSPDRKKAYLFVQPSEYFTRQLILHEATHQFHYLAATGNQNPGVDWYAEGLAEYFGMHDWDGKTLKTGVVPSITLEDYPAHALKNFDALKQDLQGIVDATTACDRPEAWALVHFLMKNHEEKFRDLASRLDRQAKPAIAWKSVFGDVTPDLVKRFRAWIEKNAQPWRVVWTAWQERGGALEGSSATNGIAILKTRPAKLVVEVEPLGPLYIAGLVFAFKSADEFHLAQVLSDGTAKIMKRAGGRWTTVTTVRKPETKERDVIELSFTAAATVVKINGGEIGTVDATGDVGLNVDACRALFRLRE